MGNSKSMVSVTVNKSEGMLAKLALKKCFPTDPSNGDAWLCTIEQTVSEKLEIQGK